MNYKTNLLFQRLEALETHSAIERNSERYGHISSLDVLSAIDSLIDMDSLRLNRGRGQGTYHELTARLKHEPVSIGGDTVYPTIHLYNSYAGESPVKLFIGMYRVICSNGLVVGSSIFKAEARHIKGPKLDSILNRLNVQLGEGIAKLETIVSNVQLLDNVACDRTTVERILDESKLSFKAYHRALNAYAKPKRQADVGDSAWRVYNRVQETLDLSSAKGIDTNKVLMDLFIENTNVSKQLKTA